MTFPYFPFVHIFYISAPHISLFISTHFPPLSFHLAFFTTCSSFMATIHHRSSPSTRPRRHSLDYSSLPSHTTSSSSLSFIHPATISLSSHAITFSLSSAASATTTPTTSPDTGFSLDVLESHLASGNFRQADEETRRLLIVLAGEAAMKRGYVFFSEVQFIPEEELKGIDELWRKFSNNRFGYSVQKKIWLKVNKDFTRFFMRVGWMKKLDTEVEQYNYRSFPDEFVWELNVKEEEASSSSSSMPPEGHLPLTNALRGTQLLNCILSHPAFAEGETEASDGDDGVVKESDNNKSRLASLRDRLFKPNYTF